MNGLAKAFLIGVVAANPAALGSTVHLALAVKTEHRVGDVVEGASNEIHVLRAEGREGAYLLAHACKGSRLAVECRVESRGGMVALVVERVLRLHTVGKEKP